MIRVAIGIPAYTSRVSAGHLLQAAQLSWAWCRNGLPSPYFITVDSAGVDKARNILVAKALQAKADWLLMCDADTYHPIAPAIWEMLATGEKRGAAVIGAPVKMRKRDGYNVSRGDDFALVPPDEFRNAVIEVDRIGTAFTAINLKWIAEHWGDAPWFQFIYKPAGATVDVLGEDYAFCGGVKQRGGLILADGRFEPVHVEATNEMGMLSAIGVDAFTVLDAHDRNRVQPHGANGQSLSTGNDP